MLPRLTVLARSSIVSKGTKAPKNVLHILHSSAYVERIDCTVFLGYCEKEIAQQHESGAMVIFHLDLLNNAKPT